MNIKDRIIHYQNIFICILLFTSFLLPTTHDILKMLLILIILGFLIVRLYFSRIYVNYSIFVFYVF